MNGDPLPLVVGLPGTVLTAAERAVLERVRPTGVILFARNIGSAEQVRELVAALRELEPSPFVCIDLEGGAVNRLAGVWGPLPSPAEAAAAGLRAVRALGEAAGAGCRSLGIHLDLAPAVDLECPDGVLARQSRCLSDDPERVATLARVFVQGLRSWSVEGCLKHFPGIGALAADTHDQLPFLAAGERELKPHLDAFATLSEEVPVVMVGHVVVPSLGDDQRPASLSPTIVKRAARLPGSPLLLSDDLEMGALAEWGDLPERVLAVLRAQNHGALVCSAFDRLDEIAALVRAEAGPKLVLSTRLDTFRRDLGRTLASVPAPDDTTVAQLWDLARQKAAP